MDRELAVEWLESRGGDIGIEYYEEAEWQHGAFFDEHFPEGEAGLEELKRDFATYVMASDNPCPECGGFHGYFDEDDKLRCARCHEVQPFDGAEHSE